MSIIALVAIASLYWKLNVVNMLLYHGRSMDDALFANLIFVCLILCFSLIDGMLVAWFASLVCINRANELIHMYLQHSQLYRMCIQKQKSIRCEWDTQFLVKSLQSVQNYAAGNPASVLYIKNLGKDVVADDFYSIFGELNKWFQLLAVTQQLLYLTNKWENLLFDNILAEWLYYYLLLWK